MIDYLNLCCIKREVKQSELCREMRDSFIEVQLYTDITEESRTGESTGRIPSVSSATEKQLVTMTSKVSSGCKPVYIFTIWLHLGYALLLCSQNFNQMCQIKISILFCIMLNI